MSNISRPENYFNRPLASFVHISPELIDELVSSLIELSEKGDIRKSFTGRYSIYDIIERITDKSNPHLSWKRLLEQHPDLYHYVRGENLGKSSGYLDTPTCELETAIEIIWLLPGEISNKLRKVSAKIVGEIVTQKSTELDQNQILTAVSQLTNVVLSQNQNSQLTIASLQKQNERAEKSIQILQEQLVELRDTQKICNEMVNEYITLRKSTETNFVGLAQMNDFIIESKGLLQPVKIKFTCSEWIQQHAPYLSPLQVVRFQRMVADSHRLIVDKQPTRDGLTYQYTSDSEVIFRRVLDTIKKHIPYERADNSISIKSDLYVKPEQIKLSVHEEMVVGTFTKLYKLSGYLGFKIDPRDTALVCKLTAFITDLRKQKLIKLEKKGTGTYFVTYELVDAVKQFISLYSTEVEKRGNENG